MKAIQAKRNLDGLSIKQVALQVMAGRLGYSRLPRLQR